MAAMLAAIKLLLVAELVVAAKVAAELAADSAAVLPVTWRCDTLAALFLLSGGSPRVL
jgi:Tfp pilus assembly major pilin PilA